MKTLACRLCEAKLPEPILRLPNTPIANQFVKSTGPQEKLPLQLVSCTNCHHYQLDYSVAADELFNADYAFVTGTSPVNVKYFEKYAKDTVDRFKLEPGDFVFEIAANDGTLLKAFQKLGMKVLGVDPASSIAIAAGKGKDGVEIIPKFFTEALAEEVIKTHGKAKLIIANNVLAHLDNVPGIIKGVSALLDKNGVFVFENSYFKDMYVNNLPDLIYHEHMSHFLVFPLLVLFQTYNMCFFDVQSQPVHGGSIRGFVSNERRDMVNVDDFIKEERALGLIGQGYKNIKMTNWSHRIDTLRDDLATRLAAHKAAGKKIVAYGAPAKFTTLSYILDLNKEMIDYVVDDNPLKQGTLTPGKHIPVVPRSRLLEDQPDVIVLTAWNFADSIIAKYPDFMGTWIVPLPKIKELKIMPIKGRRAKGLREVTE